MKRHVFVRPDMSGVSFRFCRGYTALDNQSLTWQLPHVPTASNPHAETFHTLHLQDGTFLRIGVSERNGAVTSVAHVQRDGTYRHWLRHYDNGQCFLANMRFRLADVEYDPTEDGGSAGDALFYPSVGDPVRVARLPDGSLLVERVRHAIIDFDPDNLEDGYGRRPVPASMPPNTQLLWTGGIMRSEHIIRTDGRCHTYGFQFVDNDGSADGVLKAWLSCGMLIADIAHGGCDLLDLETNERRRIRGEEWRGAAITDASGATRYRRGWNGFKTRVDLLDPSKSAVAQPPVWTSGHAATILHTGADGEPDGKSALGIYARLVDTSDRDPIGKPERMQVSVMRNPQLVGDATDGSKALAMKNSGYGVVVGSHGNGAYEAGHSATISFDWITGTPEQVEAALRRSYAERQEIPW